MKGSCVCPGVARRSARRGADAEPIVRYRLDGRWWARRDAARLRSVGDTGHWQPNDGGRDPSWPPAAPPSQGPDQEPYGYRESPYRDQRYEPNPAEPRYPAPQRQP